MSKKPSKSKKTDPSHVVAESGRGGKLRPDDPKRAEAIEFARRSFRKYVDTYKALSK